MHFSLIFQRFYAQFGPIAKLPGANFFAVEERQQEFQHLFSPKLRSFCASINLTKF